MAAMGIVRACAPPAAVGASSAAPSAQTNNKSSRTARVLVLGGTGRVGASTAAALSKLRPDLTILVGGRNREKGESFASKLGEQSEFVQVDTRNANMLEQALQGVDAYPRSGKDGVHLFLKCNFARNAAGGELLQTVTLLISQWYRPNHPF